jgi:hypothetical protein
VVCPGLRLADDPHRVKVGAWYTRKGRTNVSIA